MICRVERFRVNVRQTRPSFLESNWVLERLQNCCSNISSRINAAHQKRVRLSGGEVACAVPHSPLPCYLEKRALERFRRKIILMKTQMLRNGLVMLELCI